MNYNPDDKFAISIAVAHIATLNLAMIFLDLIICRFQLEGAGFNFKPQDGFGNLALWKLDYLDGSLAHSLFLLKTSELTLLTRFNMHPNKLTAIPKSNKNYLTIQHSI